MILACRSPTRCVEAADQIRASTPAASLETGVLDTSSLASVRSFGSALLEAAKPLDMLVLNAGVGISQGTRLSEDGIELLFATNHVGAPARRLPSVARACAGLLAKREGSVLAGPWT